MNAAGNILSNFISYVINPAILLVFTAGFLLFLWGLVRYMFELAGGGGGGGHGGGGDGKQHMLWGLVGMFIMVSVYGILALIDNTFHLQSTNLDVSRMQNILPAANFFGN